MRELFMALVAGNQGHGYEIKQALEHEFGPVLPALNSGQIYSTLARLERDGLVEGHDVPDDSRGKKRLPAHRGRTARAWNVGGRAGFRERG